MAKLNERKPCAECGTPTALTLLQNGLCTACRSDLVREQEAKRAALRDVSARKSAGKSLVEKEKEQNAGFDARAEAKKEMALRELARRRFLPFVQRFHADYIPGWVHADICQRLEGFMEAVERKESPRLMIFMPPRHGKSTLTSGTWPAWVLGHHPTWEFMMTSYSGALSNKFSRDVRTILRDRAYHALFSTRLDKDSQSVEEWATNSGGGLVAAGVGGAITGKGAHILLIDDPVKNREDAESETVRQGTWDWYTSTAYSRLAPGGGVLVIQTRWHDDDLSGRLIVAQAEGADQWEIVQYAAIAEQDEKYRKKGEALHPERYNTKALARIRRVSERDWWALYQQQPVSDEGAYFTKDMFQYYRELDCPPKDEMVFYTAWDFAIGQKEQNDWTVGITVGIDREENLWVVDRQRGKWNGLEIVEKVISTWEIWGSQITGVEHGQINMALGPFLDKRITEKKAWGLHIEPLKTGRRDKPARARPIQGMMAAGKVHFPHAQEQPWVLELVNEMLRFPSGVHDDQVDAMGWIGQMIVEMVPRIPPPPKKKPSWKDKLEQYITDGSNRHWLTE